MDCARTKGKIDEKNNIFFHIVEIFPFEYISNGIPVENLHFICKGFKDVEVLMRFMMVCPTNLFFRVSGSIWEK